MTNNQLKKLASKYGTPLYVYDSKVIESRFKALDKAIKYKPHSVYYAVKANSNLHILKLMQRLGAYADAASPAEVYLAKFVGYKPSHVSVTGPNLSKDELKYILNKKIVINADSLSQLEKVGKLKRGARVGIRINPEVGDGHHKKVITAGPNSTFGIYHKETDKVKAIAKKYNLKIVGIHQHIGSGILKVSQINKAVNVLFGVAKQFDDLEYLDFGGGLGVPYKPGDKPLNVKDFGEKLSKKMEAFSKKYGKKLELRIEPGRFLVAEAGTLLMQVTTTKKTPAGEQVAGTNSGMTHLIRPALYGAYHEIVNVSNPRGRKTKTTVVGNVCETSDVFAKDRPLSKAEEGDILAVKNTGAYGMAMASRFNGRLMPAEVLVSGKKTKVIRKRDRFKDLLPK